MKLDEFELKQLTRALRDEREYLEQSEYCAECLIIKDIRELNLVTGVCFQCKPGKKINLDDAIKQLKEKYGDEFNEFFSRK